MKILFLNKRVLFPADTGGRIRTLNVVRHLARWHELTYVCGLQPGEEQYEASMRGLGLTLETVPWREAPRGSAAFYRGLAANVFSRFPFNVSKDYDPALRARAARLLESGRHDLVICDFVQMGRNALGLPARASVLFQHNVEAEIFERHARTDKGWLRRRFMAYQAAKMRHFEETAGRRFDAVIAVSERDKRAFEERYGWRHVQVIDTAVDTEFFRPAPEPEDPWRLVFVGSLDWLPNQDGIEWFVREVFPLIRARCPAIHFQIVGRNPPPGMLELAASAGVELVGTVADVRPYLARAAAVVVPLRIGGGTRIKIFEAMAMQKAVVSTALGAEGLPVTSGENILIADTPQDFAAAVTGLLNDSERRGTIARAARRLVEDNYSAETVARQFERICRETVESRPAINGHAVARP
jgi:glycosyltransferase involved in cell wall biosynthesis